MSEQFMNLPVCVSPWYFIGLGWNTFIPCCLGAGFEFGDIMNYPDDADILGDVFNHDVFVKIRKELLSGNIPEPCQKCGKKNASGGLPRTANMLMDNLYVISDKEQRDRVQKNISNCLLAIENRESVVSYSPLHAHITCGSACNIRCKFCYNCHMTYNPEPECILRIIDKMHETLLMVTLTGGEPLVTKAGRAILNEFANNRYKFGVNLATNGQYTNFELLKPVNLTWVSISTDGATKKVYETVRVGGDFEDLISNIKKYVAMKKEKPYMMLTSTYTVTSDNYMDIPEACKLYADLGLEIRFSRVIRPKHEPQNIAERVDLYDSYLLKLDEGLRATSNAATRNSLLALQEFILNKLKGNEHE